MKVVFDFVEGKITYDEFEAELYLHPEIWKWVQSLVPKDIEKKECKFRKVYENMSGFEANNYSVYSTVNSFGYTGWLAHYLISSLVKYNYPDTVCKEPPEKSSVDLLDKMNLWFLGGKEADELIKDILLENRGKTQKELKDILKNTFHLQPRMRPNWAQEPEWPVENGVPLKFVGQKREGEKNTYYFENVTTGHRETVIQYL